MALISTFGKQLNGPGYVNVGVALWLRADDNVSTSETWLDYSGNSNDAQSVECHAATNIH